MVFLCSSVRAFVLQRCCCFFSLISWLFLISIVFVCGRLCFQAKRDPLAHLIWSLYVTYQSMWPSYPTLTPFPWLPHAFWKRRRFCFENTERCWDSPFLWTAYCSNYWYTRAKHSSFYLCQKTFLSVLLSGSWLPSVCRKPTHAFEEHLLMLIKTLAMVACKPFPWDLLFGRCLSSPQGVVRLWPSLQLGWQCE